MYKKYMKRALDIALSILILPLFLTISIPVSIIIRLDDRGPIIYRVMRLGKNLKEFTMLKFRTMKVNSPDIRNEDGSTYNSENDSRLTRVGKVLRKTSIDEVPQILNVLKGDMSLVGPRPSPLGNIDRYSREYLKKFDVRPGITGYNQVKLRNNCTQEQREQNDLYYIHNISLALDLKILSMTIFSVIRARDINRNNRLGSNNKHEIIG